MNYKIKTLDYLNSLTFRDMMFRPHIPLLGWLGKGKESPLLAVGAFEGEKPVGLLLSFLYKEEGEAEFLSAFTKKEHRRQGIAEAMLKFTEENLIKNGYRTYEISIERGKPMRDAFEKLVLKSDYPEPEFKALMCRATSRMRAAPWLYKDLLPPSCEIFLWKNITDGERKIIIESQKASKWFPDNLYPFTNEKNIEYGNSLGLRYKGEVVGWVINHRPLPNLIRYTYMFVRDELQKYGFALPLLINSIRRHVELTDPSHVYITGVGSDVRGGKIKLPYQMGSLDQVYEGEICDWIGTWGLQKYWIDASDKLDGTSAMVIYDPAGNFQIAYSRGNGTEGADISRHIKQFDNVPQTTDQTLVVRGEVILTKEGFQKLSSILHNRGKRKYKNARNEHALLSEKKAWKMLYQWLTISPIQAENYFRSAIGLPAENLKPVDKFVEERHKVMSPILSLSYSKPIVMVRSAFQYMYDAHGNTFLDAYNNIPHVGHSHPQVVAAGQKQMAKLNTNTRYLYDILYEYSENLLSKFPDSLNKLFFVNSGSAASDLAIRLARAHTGHGNLMVMEHGYHGHTQIGIEISDYKFSNKRGPGQKEFILKAAIPDTFRGKYRNNDGSAGKQYAREAIEQINRSALPIAAFISEPVVGCAGQIPLAKGYLQELYPVIQKQGGVCISDEVQTGFGRLGDHFWGFEAQNVVPDIVILGKPMANGHPMGAVVTTTEIADSFGLGVEFFSSFGGNPVSCAMGQAVLQVIEEESLQENARIVGNYYKSLLMELLNQFPGVGDVRGSGLFLGVEIVKDDMEPDTLLANHLKNELRNRHILVSTDGPFENVLKTKPPLCFSKENAQQVTDQMVECLKNIA